ncbi:hypothetical protein SK128_025033, partial [Halocaridina rubra]
LHGHEEKINTFVETLRLSAEGFFSQKNLEEEHRRLATDPATGARRESPLSSTPWK